VIISQMITLTRLTYLGLVDIGGDYTPAICYVHPLGLSDQTFYLGFLLGCEHTNEFFECERDG
jgi:hypothetical protein